MNFLRRLFRRAAGRKQSPADRAETDAQKSARKYWQREVADEKVRRGTPDRPQKD
jgi:hypothetical protein